MYPRLFSEEEENLIASPVTIEEVRKVLDEFSEDKSLSPDSWMTGFFRAFFDIMGEEVLVAVEESRQFGKIFGALNATFIALITKKDNPNSWKYFRLISLCNLLYKVISKIILNIINPVLSRCMCSEQFGFLDGRQILDAIASAQETLHSIKIQKINSLILKIDLIKEYDRVDWSFLRLVLL